MSNFRIVVLVAFCTLGLAAYGQDEPLEEEEAGVEEFESESSSKDKKGFFSKLKFGKKKSKSDTSEVDDPYDDLEEKDRGPGGSGLLNKIFGNFTFGASLGYGRTFYKHDLPGFAVLNRDDVLQIIDKDSLTPLGTNSGYAEWVTRPTRADSIALSPTDSLFASDSADITYKGRGSSIPIDLFVYYTINRYRVGAGATFEFHSIGNFSPSQAEGLVGTFRPIENKSRFTRYYVMVGGEIYSYYNYFLTADLKVGKYTLGKAFDKTLASPSFFLNLGVNLEKRLSEILGVFIRPSIETKSYKMALPGSDKVIKHSIPAFFVQAGATYRIPDLPKCPIEACHIQINHEHSGKRYRSRRHPIWKKQNPHYGENYPVLIKDKGKNKKKRNPY